MPRILPNGYPNHFYSPMSHLIPRDEFLSTNTNVNWDFEMGKKVCLLQKNFD